MALNAQILLSILAHETANGDISQTLRATPATYALPLSDGTGANQAQVVWSDSRTATTIVGAGDILDLQALSDDRGTVSFTAIKAMYLRNTGSEEIQWNDSNGSAWLSFLGQPNDSEVRFPAGGAMLITAPGASGFAVSNLSRTLRFVVDSAGSSTYEIILIGEGTVT